MSDNYAHPYSMETARWIRASWLMEKDTEKQMDFLKTLSEQFGAESAEILQYISNDYRVFIRDDQMWPDFDDESWDGAVWSCGRGFGKTYAGAPACVEYAIDHPECLIGLLAPTFSMGRDNMILGSSGIVNLSPKGFKPKYNKSEGLLTWPNGSKAKLYSAENGDRVRGQNFNFIFADEYCFFKFTGDDKDLWKMAKLALRAGRHPKWLITTSPRPIKELRNLYTESKKEGSRVRFTTGTTFDNYTLPKSYLDQIRLDEGTSLYNQEILGMILDENPGAIFTNENILRHNLDTSSMSSEDYDKELQKLINSMDKIVVGVDPNVVEDIDSDETGITIVGRKNDKAYVFKDGSRRGSIKDIYDDIVRYYHQYQADCVVVETNNGGDFIPAAIFNIDEMVVVEKVFASRGKKARAEPIGLLYERHKVFHVGIHRELEAQMCEYNPQVTKKSPDYPKSVWSKQKCLHCKNFLIAGIPNKNKRQYLLVIVNDL